MHRILASGTAVIAVALVACSDPGGEVPLRDVAVASGAGSAVRPGDPLQGGQDSTARKGPGRRGGGSGATNGGADPGARGGRGPRNTSIILGVADVYKVAHGLIEATIPISGDLRPLDVNTLRSRVDGLLETVLVREGQIVAAGALLAKFESVEQEASLRSAEADVAATKSDYETARWNADQSKELFRVGAIAERDLRSAEQAAEASRARQLAAEARLRTATNALRDTRVVAPFAGTIEKRFVQGGENTSRGTQMFTVVRSLTLELTASLPARRADDVKPGQPVRFVADSRQFNGRIARVSPTIDPASRSVTVYVQVANPKGELKGNTFASGQVIVSSIDDALVIPQSSVRTSADGSRQFVYRIQAGELAMAPVRLGIVDEARGIVQVLEGLKELDQIVVGSPGTLGPGMKVQVIGNEGRGGRGQKSAP